MPESIEYDLIVAGSGLAGLRAAIEAAKKSSKIKIGVIAKTQVMRSHSVSAEGGTAAVIQEDDGDTIESHIYDTVKGSDFLADQDVAERLCQMIPNEIYQIKPTVIAQNYLDQSIFHPHTFAVNDYLLRRRRL